MKADNGRTRPIEVMAVLVLYRRAAHEAASWPMLCAMMGHPGKFVLKHCLIHDNSPQEVTHFYQHLPQGFELRLNPGNVGTAGAYAGGLDVAKAQKCEWLLLLDQDTLLPTDYLARAAASLSAADVLVPRVWHGEQLLSPGVLTTTGSIRPTYNLPEYGQGRATAISSGVLARVTAIEASLPFPREMWLDYVDHWMFLSFARNGFRIAAINADLAHDLSIKEPASLAPDRLESILRAETALYRHLGIAARLILPIRRAMRGLRFLSGGHSHLATITFRHFATVLFAR
jgi:hypothetical protein